MQHLWASTKKLSGGRVPQLVASSATVNAPLRMELKSTGMIDRTSNVTREWSPPSDAVIRRARQLQLIDDDTPEEEKRAILGLQQSSTGRPPALFVTAGQAKHDTLAIPRNIMHRYAIASSSSIDHKLLEMKRILDHRRRQHQQQSSSTPTSLPGVLCVVDGNARVDAMQWTFKQLDIRAEPLHVADTPEKVCPPFAIYSYLI
jgi:hypothetical protein